MSNLRPSGFKWSRVSVSESEIIAWIKKRIRSAIPILRIPNVDVRSEIAQKAIAWILVLRNQQLQSIKHLIRESKRPDRREKERERGRRPENVQKRHARYQLSKGTEQFRKDLQARQQRYNLRHPDRIRSARSRWISEGGGREWMRNYMAQRRKEDLNYNIGNRLRSRIAHAVRGSGVRKALKTCELVGCSLEQLRKWLESKFTEGMNWDKFLSQEIHIDHAKPVDSFDLSDPDQQKVCFHFTNLQPLWARDNLSKRNKYANP